MQMTTNELNMIEAILEAVGLESINTPKKAK